MSNGDHGTNGSRDRRPVPPGPDAGGRLYVGTSGFAYPAWAPVFYPAGARPADLLRLYSARLPAVELNNTFYQQPRPERVTAWLAQVPADFRFCVKAQRGGSLRAFGAAAQETLSWLTTPYRLFGERLGCVLFRVPGNVQRDDARLVALLDAWPPDLPLTVDCQHSSWHVPAVVELLRQRGAVMCVTDLDEAPFAGDLPFSGRFVYVRLRRNTYTPAQLAAWAARLEPHLAAGRDCYVFLRHDELGTSAEGALHLRRVVSDFERASHEPDVRQDGV